MKLFKSRVTLNGASALLKLVLWLGRRSRWVRSHVFARGVGPVEFDGSYVVQIYYEGPWRLTEEQI